MKIADLNRFTEVKEKTERENVKTQKKSDVLQTGLKTVKEVRIDERR